jgi:hypothetical protein
MSLRHGASCQTEGASLPQVQPCVEIAVFGQAKKQLASTMRLQEQE